MAQGLVTKVGVETEDLGGAHNLRCPRCGSDYLHHYAVTMYERGEDEGKVVRTHIENGATTTEIVSSTAGNPSSRRHGMTVSFTCETCPDRDDRPLIELTIAQHKGNTEIGWRHAPAARKKP